MALTRKMLKGMGLSEEQADTIIEAHTETVDGLKGQIKDLTDRASAADALKQERDRLQQQIDAAASGTDWKAEYDKLKADTEAKETAAKVRTAYRKLLEEAHIDGDVIDTVMEATNFSGMKLDREGALQGADKLTEAIATRWAKFVVTEEQRGTPTKTPPAGKGQPAFETMNLTQKMQYANQHPGDPDVQKWLANPIQPTKDDPAKNDPAKNDGAQK